MVVVVVCVWGGGGGGGHRRTFTAHAAERLGEVAIFVQMCVMNPSLYLGPVKITPIRSHLCRKTKLLEKNLLLQTGVCFSFVSMRRACTVKTVGK